MSTMCSRGTPTNPEFLKHSAAAGEFGFPLSQATQPSGSRRSRRGYSDVFLPSARRAGSNRQFQVLDLYWRSPKSRNVWFKSRRLKKTISSRSEGWWCGKPATVSHRMHSSISFRKPVSPQKRQLIVYYSPSKY